MKANIKDIGARVASLIMLGSSFFFLGRGVHAALLAYYVSLTSSSKIHISAILLQTNSLVDIAIGLIILTAASFVWNWKINGKTFGFFICIAGFNYIVLSFDTLAHPPFKEISPFNNMFPTSIIVGFVSAAAICFAVGLLSIRQTKKTTTA